MVFLFKFPGSFSTDFEGLNLSYVPDFLHYVVTPAFAPWITALITIIVTLPLLALIYGGIRLIFWFRVRDGWVWLSGIVLWTISAAVLSVMLFNEGVSFAETARSVQQQSYQIKSDTLYIMTGKSIDRLDYDNDIIIPDDEYSVFISEEKSEIYIAAETGINPGDAETLDIEIRKGSSGRNRNDAIEKSERLIYNHSFSNDTLYLDEYFTVPSGTKWSFDHIGVNIIIPVGKIVYLDRQADRHIHSNDHYNDYPYSKKKFWLMTEDGLQLIEEEKENK